MKAPIEKQLKTKVSLEIGEYPVKIKATDNKGGSITEDITISVLQGDTKDNLIYTQIHVRY